MSVSKGKCYLKRKRFLNEVSQEILTTLQRIYYVRNEIVSDSQIKEQAQKYAQKIEAVCLTPKYKMSNDEYHNVLLLKTQELCDVLKRNMLPSQSSQMSIPSNQQHQALQQVSQRNGADLGSNDDKSNYGSKSIEINDKVSLKQENRYDLQASAELINHQQFPVPVSSKTVSKKNKSRKTNVKSSVSSKLSSNQKASISSISQMQSEERDNVSVLQNNIATNDQQCYYGSIGNSINSKPQFYNSYIQDFDFNEEITSNIDDIMDLQKNYVGNYDTSFVNSQNSNNLVQPQMQQLQTNEISKSPFLRYGIDDPINDSATIFPIAPKDSSLFPVIESNYTQADAFNFTDESLFDSNCIKDGLEFDESVSFSLM